MFTCITYNFSLQLLIITASLNTDRYCYMSICKYRTKENFISMNICQIPGVLLQMTHQLHKKFSCVTKAINPAACALENTLSLRMINYDTKAYSYKRNSNQPNPNVLTNYILCFDNSKFCNCICINFWGRIPYWHIFPLKTRL